MGGNDIDSRKITSVIEREEPLECKPEDEEAKKVLVVEDDHELAHAMSLYFRLQGLEVITAGDGASAIEATEIMSPDAIILDINLPQLDGLAFCNFLRYGLADRSTPVIVVTGITDRDWRLDMLEAGANEYLTKPCDFRKLYSIVRDYLGAD